MAKEEKPTSIFSKTNTNMLLVVILVMAAFAIGYLFNRVQQLEKGATAGAKTAVGTNPSPSDNQPQAPKGNPEKAAPVTESDHKRGDSTARIILFEYSDYQCPYCSSFHPTTKQIVDEYSGQVAMVYRHFPLDAIHPLARPAAVASECVANLAGNDAFWSYTDQVFESTDSDILSASSIKSIATSLGVSASEYDNCIASSAAKDAVESDYQSGIEAGVTGTPGNILYDTETGKAQLIPGALPFAQMKSAIDSMLQG